MHAILPFVELPDVVYQFANGVYVVFTDSNESVSRSGNREVEKTRRQRSLDHQVGQDKANQLLDCHAATDCQLNLVLAHPNVEGNLMNLENR